MPCAPAGVPHFVFSSAIRFAVNVTVSCWTDAETVRCNVTSAATRLTRDGYHRVTVAEEGSPPAPPNTAEPFTPAAAETQSAGLRLLAAGSPSSFALAAAAASATAVRAHSSSQSKAVRPQASEEFDTRALFVSVATRSDVAYSTSDAAVAQCGAGHWVSDGVCQDCPGLLGFPLVLLISLLGLILCANLRLFDVLAAGGYCPGGDRVWPVAGAPIYSASIQLRRRGV